MNEPTQTFRLRLSAREKEHFVSAARDLYVPYNVLMRHLIRYVLRDNIDWMLLLEDYRKLNEQAAEEAEYSASQVTDKGKDGKRASLSTQLTPDMYDAFTGFAKSWGTTANIVLRRLMMLYSAGKIERCAILRQ